MRPSPLPRERIPWDEEHEHPIAANPHHCVLGCNACMELCPVQAISLPAPQELRETIRRLRTEQRAATAAQAPGG